MCKLSIIITEVNIKQKFKIKKNTKIVNLANLVTIFLKWVYKN